MKKAIIDMHTHTVFGGHAYSTIKENIDAANEVGLKFLGTSEHGIKMPGGPHEYFFHNLKVIPRQVGNVKILRGIEANILDFNGRIDISDYDLKKLDYAIASLHNPCIVPGTKEENTRALLNVMDNPFVKIIGHPDDDRYPIDYEAVVKKAAEKNILLEVNNTSLNPTSSRKGADKNYAEMFEYCKKYNTRVIFGSDSHICYSIGKFDNCEKLINELEFPEELVINYWEDQIVEFFWIDF